MYLIRRTYKTKPYEAANVAKLIKAQADIYTAIGHRAECRVYYNNGTTPGEPNRVYLEWNAEVFDNPGREENKIPKEAFEAGAKYRPLLDVENGASNWIEFWTILE
tara:strand:- start:1096 stop:1413 length:318 start_codon:yes stop_codon:yes gene_type:complete